MGEPLSAELLALADEMDAEGIVNAGHSTIARGIAHRVDAALAEARAEVERLTGADRENYGLVAEVQTLTAEVERYRAAKTYTKLLDDRDRLRDALEAVALLHNGLHYCDVGDDEPVMVLSEGLPTDPCPTIAALGVLA